MSLPYEYVLAVFLQESLLAPSLQASPMKVPIAMTPHTPAPRCKRGEAGWYDALVRMETLYAIINQGLTICQFSTLSS
jgi:hypothetical protein